MADFGINLQRAIYQRLTGEASVMNLVTGVYDHVPQVDDPEDASDFPYITIGSDNLLPFDTDTSVGSDATIQIHVWSRHRGRSQIKEIQGAIYASLHRYSLPVADNHLVGVEWEWADSVMDPDGITRQGIQRFRITIESEVI